MDILIVDATRNRLGDVISASAYTCYNSEPVAPKDSWNNKSRESIVTELFKSGHYTTFQHTHFTLIIKGVSRYLVWKLLHSHQFYNSSQTSHRYTEANCEISKNDKIYHKLIENGINKEDARYVLPLGTKTNLYHTVNLFTALKLIGIASSEGGEFKEFATKLEKVLIYFDKDIQEVIDLAKIKFAKKFEDTKEVIDDQFNLASVDKPYVLGFTDDFIFNGDGRLGGFTTASSLSFVADSQNQRHRTSTGYRVINSLLTFYTPDLILTSPFAEEYQEDIAKKIERFKKSGDERDLPHAVIVHTIEKHSLSDYKERAINRLCLTAQDEIRKNTEHIVKTIKSTRSLHVEDMDKPCLVNLKKGIKPYCTQGKRGCKTNQPWKLAQTKGDE